MKENDNEKSLMRKTKKELIDIILRKDDVEIRLKETIKTKDEEIDGLNTRLVGYEADINGLERMRKDNLTTIDDLEHALNRKRRTIRRWQIAFAITLIAAIFIISCIA